MRALTYHGGKLFDRKEDDCRKVVLTPGVSAADERAVPQATPLEAALIAG